LLTINRQQRVKSILLRPNEPRDINILIETNFEKINEGIKNYITIDSLKKIIRNYFHYQLRVQQGIINSN